MALKEKEESAAEGEIAHEVEGQEDWEPSQSLLEIKGLLIDTQTSIVNITQVNEALSKQVSGVKALLEFNDKKLRGVKISLANTTSAYAALQKQLTAS